MILTRVVCHTTWKTTTVLDVIKAVADVELVVEPGAVEAIVEDVEADVEARIMMEVVVVAERHPALKDMCTVRLTMPQTMMQCS
jgi:hypothetical protein